MLELWHHFGVSDEIWKLLKVTTDVKATGLHLQRQDKCLSLKIFES